MYLLFVFLIVALFGFAYTIGQEKDPAGKKVFLEKKCSMCHSVEPAGIISKKKDAVDLSKVGDNLNAEFLSKFLTKTEKLNGKQHKYLFKGSNEELSSLTKWLVTQKSKKIAAGK